MKFFYKWLQNKLINSCQYDGPVKIATEDSLTSHGMNFTVYKANGGFVVEHRVYDKKNDRNNNSLHIITPDQDLGEEIGKIITYESLLI